METLGWFLYVLVCADGTLYAGVTTDPARRVAEHNAGRGARYTAGRRPVRPVAALGFLGWGAAHWAEAHLRRPNRASAADLQITFIEYDPPGSDIEGQYVRIENVGGGTADMTNWTLRDDADHIFTFPTFTLSSGATVQVWTKSGTNTATDLYWGSGSAIWNNTGDCAYLRDGGGTAVDTFCY